MEYNRKHNRLGPVLRNRYRMPGIFRYSLHRATTRFLRPVGSDIHRNRGFSPPLCRRGYTPLGSTGKRPCFAARYLYDKLVLPLIDRIRFLRFTLYDFFIVSARGQ